MAMSRLNLKKLGVAMHSYLDVYSRFPAPAITDKNGKALLSWRVELLPFLGENDLYKQFHRDEPWNSPHNKQLLSKMPAVFAPPGVKTRQPYTTFYQVFVSSDAPQVAGGGAPTMGAGGAGSGGGSPASGSGAMQQQMNMMRMMMGGTRNKEGSAMGGAGGVGMMGGVAGSAAMGFAGPVAAFVKGQSLGIPHFIDGTSYIILIIEAGNPVPWTKPEDLHYAEDEPLPELGGLFADVIHAVFADGAVHTLTRKYDEKQLRYAITANDGMNYDLAKIEGRARRRGSGAEEDTAMANWKLKNAELRREVERARERIRLLREEREIEQELSGEDPRLIQLREEHAQLQSELKKLRVQIDALNAEMRRPAKNKSR
jgi:hypothetical protein